MRSTTKKLCVLALALGGAIPVLAESPEARRVTVVIDGLKSSKGSVAYAVFDSEQAFESRADPVRAGFVPIAKKQCAVSLDRLAAGSYAAAFYHDRNGNGELDRNVFGAPSEPYAFSNDARAKFGPPPYSEARFEVAESSATLRVRLK